MGKGKRERVTTGYEPHRFGIDIHNSLRRFSVLVCHRRFGKTVLAVMCLVDAACRNTRGDGRYAYVGPYLNQARGVAWDYVRKYTAPIRARLNNAESFAELPGGSRISIYGADNAHALRGRYFDGVVLDEVADMRPYVWGEVIRPALSDRKGWALFIGTPRGQNLFYDLYQRALGDPAWYADLYDINRTIGHLSWLDADEIARAKAEMSDAQFRQEYLCDFSASSEDVVISIDLVSRAAGKHLREDQYLGAPRVIGVDVARFGDDRSVIQRRQGLSAFTPKIFTGIDNMHLAGLVAQEIEEFSPHAVFIDGGRGEGVIDRLRQLGNVVTEVNFGGRALDDLHFADRRTEIWWRCREWLESGGALPDHTELRESLVVPTYSFDASNRKRLESKKDMKKRVGYSPDPADALCLTFSEPVHVPTEYETIARSYQQAEVSNDYDPFTMISGNGAGKAARLVLPSVRPWLTGV